MKYSIVGKNIAVTDGIREKIIDKLGVLEKYLRDHQDLECRVLVRVYPHGQKIEVTIPTKHAILRAEVVDKDLYSAIDLVIDKIEGQLRKVKSRMNRKNKEKFSKAIAMEEIAPDKASPDILVRTKTIELTEAIDLDEAVARMEMLSHSFFIYRDSESGRISVLYRRADGGLGIIEVAN